MVDQALTGMAFGCTFTVTGPSEVLDPLRPLLPHGWSEHPGAPAERSWTAVREHGLLRAFSEDGSELGADVEVAGVVAALAQDIELWVAEAAPGLVFVHAGVVVVDGRAVLLPGRTRAGKSTLVAALVRAGADYYSDEFAPLDRDGLVHPYRRTPKQRPESPASKWPIVVPTSDAPPVPVGLVAAIRWVEGGRLELSEIAHAAAVLPLLSNTVCATSRSVEALDVLTVAAANAGRLQGVRGEAGEAADALINHMRQQKICA